MHPEKNFPLSVFPKFENLFLPVLLKRHFWLVIPFLLISSVLFAQDDSDTAPRRRGSRIIDDTTKQVYGPNTSKYYYEEDVFYNRNIVHPIDTFIRNFHRFNYVQRNNNLYQDLGNIGTAIRPIYYQAPSVIGVRSGFDVYDMYWDSERMRYFDTKSPYSNMSIILGGRGRSMTKATFSRNISPRWNFGFTYQGLFIDKQIPERAGKGDRVTRSNYYDFYTAYHSKDSIYRIFANFRRRYHRVEESGGVNLNDGNPATDSTFDAYFIEDPQVWLNTAETSDIRMNMHFNHQLKVGKALQVYHTFDRYRQLSRFFNLYEDADRPFFTHIEQKNDTTKDDAKFKVVRNEFGIKGNLLKLFYNGYYAVRHFTMTYNHALHSEMKDSGVTPLANENILGGRMELRLDSIGLVSGWAETYDLQQYRIEGRIESRWFEASIKQLKYKPGFAEQFYRGGHHQWDSTNFPDIQSSQINGYVHYKSKALNISPGLTFTRLTNYVFYDQRAQPNDTLQDVSPVQSSGNQVIFSPELRFAITFFKNFTLSNQFIYTRLLENAGDAIRVPDLFLNSQISYSGIHFNGNFDAHIGVDLHWHSPYYAPAYDPAIRQFYNQDEFEVNAFPRVDFFLNVKVKRGRIFFKYINIVQAFTGTGYLPTPYYPGQRNVIDFGFDWSFYD
jgi:hypothetical protein